MARLRDHHPSSLFRRASTPAVRRSSSSQAKPLRWASHLLRLALLVLLLTTTGEALAGQKRAGRKSTDRYEISVLTFGPGDHAFTAFGHNAIWIRDRSKKKDTVYNFGTFAFSSDSLIQDFLQGRLRYWVSYTGLDRAIAPYRAENRSVEVQVLALSQKQERELVARLKHNALPENRYYIYDYYQDNCSTRVRDFIDDVTHGELKNISGAPETMNWREHTLRLSQVDWGVSVGLDVALGPKVDAPRTVWEEMFLPGVLQENLRKVQVGPPDKRHPLVSKEYSILEAERGSAPTQPPVRWPQMLALGSVLGGAILLLSRGRRSRSVALRRTSLSGMWTLTALMGLVFGLLGSIFCFFWFATDHSIAARNANILLMPPWALGFPLLALAAPFWRHASRVAFFLAALSLVSAILAATMGALSFWIQDTSAFVPLVLPVWAGVVLSMYGSSTSSTTSPPREG